MKKPYTSEKRPGARGWGALLAVVLVGTLVGVGILLASEKPSKVEDRATATDDRSPVPHLVDPANPELRTVMVFDTGPMQPSQPGAPLTAELLRGSMPAGATTATVLSDEDCAPDEYGISHCKNRLELANGSRLTVRHNHRMAQVSCLSPGEEVNVSVA